MKADLRGVTLVCIDTVCHELSRLAIQDCLMAADFGDVVILSDQIIAIPSAGHVLIQPNKSVDEASALLWQRVPQFVTTPHFLVVQWDSGIVCPDLWTPKFLDYDYIGAPWWYRDGMNVGNGGFSIRSTRLAKHIADHSVDYPISHPEDVALCREYRRRLEGESYTWAPEDLAWQFSFECGKPSRDSRHFGFHAMGNWPFVLGEERLSERMAICNGYVRSKGQMGWMHKNLLMMREAGR